MRFSRKMNWAAFWLTLLILVVTGILSDTPVDAHGTPTRETVAGGTGDVGGPMSSTDEAVCRMDGVTGKVIQESLCTISDAGLITCPSATISTGDLNVSSGDLNMLGGDVDVGNGNITTVNQLQLGEQVSCTAFGAGTGSICVKNTAPTTIFYVDDASTEFQFATGVHPAVTIDDTIARYDGITGDLQNSGVTLSDTDDMAFPSAGSLSVPGAGAGSQELGPSANTSTFTNSLAVGDGATCTGNNCTCIGQNCSVGSGGVCVGQGCSASAASCISIGDGAGCIVTGSISIGAGVSPSSSNSTCMGQFMTCTGGSSVGIGTSSTVSASNTVAIGVSATASAIDATATGRGTIAGGVNSSAYGSMSSASADRCTVVGAASSCTTGVDGVTLGYNNDSTTFSDVILIGHDITATANLQGEWGSVAAPTTLNVYGDGTFNAGFSFEETGGPTLLTVGAVSDGQFFQRSGTSVIGASLTISQATATSTDTITLAEGTVLVASMTLTPGAGNYMLNFSSSVLLSDNNSSADFSIFVGGVEVAASIRTAARGGGATAGTVFPVGIPGYRITGVGVSDAVEIRGNVDSGTVSIFERNISLLRE